jgi:hypothetical protein
MDYLMSTATSYQVSPFFGLKNHVENRNNPILRAVSVVSEASVVARLRRGIIGTAFALSLSLSLSLSQLL